MPRPAGRRCLVIAAEGKTTSRQRNGAILHASFSSSLPGGSARSHTSRDAFCILDCIWDAAQETFWVLDLMCWGGHALLDCSAEFRMFWLASKLTEESDAAAERKAASVAAQTSPSQGEMTNPRQATADGADAMEADEQAPTGQHLHNHCTAFAIGWRLAHDLACSCLSIRGVWPRRSFRSACAGMILCLMQAIPFASLALREDLLDLKMMPDESRPATSDFHLLGDWVHRSDASGLPGPQEDGFNKTGLASHIATSQNEALIPSISKYGRQKAAAHPCR